MYTLTTPTVTENKCIIGNITVFTLAARGLINIHAIRYVRYRKGNVAIWHKKAMDRGTLTMYENIIKDKVAH